MTIELVERINAAPRERGFPNVRPSDAATLIVIDRTGATPKVLMGKRHAGLKFMPGKFVFPGGRIEKGDRQMLVAGALHPLVEERLMMRVQRPNMMRARALALAAIRETYEETGLMIGSLDYGAPSSAPEGPWQDFVQHGIFPELEHLHFIARAITPPRRPKRFDARFFAIDADQVCAKVEGIVGPDAELVELVWIPLPEAQALDLPPITSVMLSELENRIAAGFSHHLPVPFYYEQRGRIMREEL